MRMRMPQWESGTGVNDGASSTIEGYLVKTGSCLTRVLVTLANAGAPIGITAGTVRIAEAMMGGVKGIPAVGVRQGDRVPCMGITILTTEPGTVAAPVVAAAVAIAERADIATVRARKGTAALGTSASSTTKASTTGIGNVTTATAIDGIVRVGTVSTTGAPAGKEAARMGPKEQARRQEDGVTDAVVVVVVVTAPVGKRGVGM